MVRVLLLEDEEYTLRFLQALIAEHPMVDSIYAATTARDAIKIANKFSPDVAFLDIELDPQSSINGMEVANVIRASNPDIKLVFVTGYTKYALDSFEVHPYDYIVKPVKKSRVLDAISSLGKSADLYKRSRLSIKTGAGIHFIDPEEIFFMEKCGKTLIFHCSNGPIEAICTFGELEPLLPEDYFKRVHKSYIVNTKHIRSIKGIGNRSYEITFNGYQKTAYMSRQKYQEYKPLFSPII